MYLILATNTYNSFRQYTAKEKVCEKRENVLVANLLSILLFFSQILRFGSSPFSRRKFYVLKKWEKITYFFN